MFDNIRIACQLASCIKYIENIDFLLEYIYKGAAFGGHAGIRMSVSGRQEKMITFMHHLAIISGSEKGPIFLVCRQGLFPIIYLEHLKTRKKLN